MGEIIFSVEDLAKEMNVLSDVATILQEKSELFRRWQWDDKADTLRVKAYQVRQVAEFIGNIRVSMSYDDGRKTSDLP